MGGMYESTKQDLELILDDSITGEFDNVLLASQWPSADDVRSDISDYLQPFMHRYNMAEFAFILTPPTSQYVLVVSTHDACGAYHRMPVS